MVRVIDLARTQLSDEDLSALAGGPVFVAGDATLYRRLFADRGIEARSLPAEGLTDGSVLIIVPTGGALYELVTVTDRLLGPGGCPWDQAQTHETLKKYLIEEAYEVLDAVDSGDPASLEEELGDLLLQPVLHAQISKKSGGFDIEGVARTIVQKLIRRHPHVFGEIDVEDADEVLRNWDAIKKTEKGDESRSILAGVPKGMASLLRAYQVSKRAVRVGFEWPSIEAVFEKLHEEERELREAIEGGEPNEIESEVGDLLFTAVNIARWAKVEPEEALRKMLNRFTARFMEMERLAAKELSELSFEEWDALWEQAKRKIGQKG